MIDLESLLSAYGGSRSAGSNGLQYLLNCPWCGFRDLYVAVEPVTRGYKVREAKPGDFICFKGKCGERGGFVKLFAKLENLSYTEARIQLAMESVGGKMGRRRILPPAIPPAPARAPKAPGRVVDGPRQEGEGFVPSEFIPCWDGQRWRVPKYLTGRGLNRETIESFGLGFCNSGRYEGRIVMPIECPAGSSFTTRAIDPEAKLRYLAGPRAGMLLYGWKNTHGAEEIVIVEGPFDAMACHQVGVKTVAIMGKKLRESQVLMLRATNAQRFILMLDGDALDDALQQGDQLGRHVLVAAPLGTKDPAAALEGGAGENILKAIGKALPLKGAKIIRIGARMAARRAYRGW